MTMRSPSEALPTSRSARCGFGRGRGKGGRANQASKACPDPDGAIANVTDDEVSNSDSVTTVDSSPERPPRVPDWPPKCSWADLPDAFRQIDPWLLSAINDNQPSTSAGTCRGFSGVRPPPPISLNDEDNNGFTKNAWNDDNWDVKVAESSRGGFGQANKWVSSRDPEEEAALQRKLKLIEELEDRELELRQELMNQGESGRAAYEELKQKRWMGLPPVIKEFYEEHNEVKEMEWSEIEKIRALCSNGAITVRSVLNDDPVLIKPVTRFEHVWHKYDEILAAIKENDFTEPSPIQREMWPVVMSGRDAIGIAQTGSGKTLAFLLPAFVHIENQPTPRVDRLGPTVLILTPTRELAQQIHAEVNKYHYKLIRSVVVIGGACQQLQTEMLAKHIEIVIGTPGRLNALIDTGSLRLDDVSYFVLDEADRMLDPDFYRQIQSMLGSTRNDRTTVMTSATWPDKVRQLAESHMIDPVLISIGKADKLTACKDVDLRIQVCLGRDKADIVGMLLRSEPDAKMLIFCNTKATVENVVHTLKDRTGRRDIHRMRGGKDIMQSEREHNIAMLRDGTFKILVTTDVMARGHDIKGIAYVVNYDLPKNIDEFIHRVGRTGRAGTSGKSLSLFTIADDLPIAHSLVDILLESGQSHNIPQALSEVAATSRQEMEARREKRELNKQKYGGGRNDGPTIFIDPFTGEEIGTSVANSSTNGNRSAADQPNRDSVQIQQNLLETSRRNEFAGSDPLPRGAGPPVGFAAHTAQALAEKKPGKSSKDLFGGAGEDLKAFM